MIFCCGREYDVLFSVLYILERNIDDVTFIISKDLPNKGYRERLLRLPFVGDVIEVNDIGLHEHFFFKYRTPIFGVLTNLFLLNYKMNKTYSGRLNSLLTKRNKNNSILHVFFANTALKIFMVKKFKNVVFLEEGKGIYRKNYPAIYVFLRKILGLGDPYGRDQKVKKVVLSKPECYFRVPQKKVEIFSIVDALRKFRANGVFLSLFPVEYHSVPSGVKIAVILTQPLSEDRLCSEVGKIDFYQKIYMTLQSRGYLVFLKQHPRDGSIYSFVPKSHLLDQSLMMELLVFEEEIDIAVSINSTAGDNLVGCKRTLCLIEGELRDINSIDLGVLYEV